MSEPEKETDETRTDEKKEDLTPPLKTETTRKREKRRPIPEPRTQHRDPPLITR